MLWFIPVALSLLLAGGTPTPTIALTSTPEPTATPTPTATATPRFHLYTVLTEGDTIITVELGPNVLGADGDIFAFECPPTPTPCRCVNDAIDQIGSGYFWYVPRMPIPLGFVYTRPLVAGEIVGMYSEGLANDPELGGTYFQTWDTFLVLPRPTPTATLPPRTYLPLLYRH